MIILPIHRVVVFLHLDLNQLQLVLLDHLTATHQRGEVRIRLGYVFLVGQALGLVEIRANILGWRGYAAVKVDWRHLLLLGHYQHLRYVGALVECKIVVRALGLDNARQVHKSGLHRLAVDRKGSIHRILELDTHVLRRVVLQHMPKIRSHILRNAEQNLTLHAAAHGGELTENNDCDCVFKIKLNKK
jgi:hypothetical protein